MEGFQVYQSYYGADSKSGAGFFSSRFGDAAKESGSFYNAESKYDQFYGEEEEKFDSDDDELVLDEDQLRFYSDILDGKVNLSGEDPLWEMKSTLNASLCKLFDKQPTFRGDESAWEKPSSHGLQNSAPIVLTKYNALQHEAKADSKPYSTNTLPYSSKDSVPSQSKGEVAPQNTLYNLIQANHVTYETAFKSTAPSTAQNYTPNSQNYGEVEGDEEEEDDEDDEDYDYNYDNNDDEVAFTGGMSADLMALLGIKVDPNAQQVSVDDWVPPTHAGLDNSDPLIARQKLHFMQNGIAAANEEDEEDDD